FVAITGLGISPQALVVHPSLPVRTLSDLVDFAKKRPGELNYGTFGIGSSGHLNIILLEGMTGTKFTPVHYRGAAPAITDLIGGPIPMIILSNGVGAQPGPAPTPKGLRLGPPAPLPPAPPGPRNIRSGPAPPTAVCRATKPVHGTDWPRPRARRRTS